MKKLYFVIFVILLNALAVDVFAQSGRVKREVPDNVVYGLVFRLAYTGWSPAEEKGFSPLDLIICRKYRTPKILNSKQEKSLRSIAYETLTETEKLDQEAKKILQDFRANLPNMRAAPGQTRPAPPPELEELQAKKIVVIENALEKMEKLFQFAEYCLIPAQIFNLIYFPSI